MNDNRRVELTISGMHCVGCSNTVSGYLKNQGAQDIFVDLTSSRATFSISSPELLPRLISGINGLGYSVADEGGASPVLTLERRFLICFFFTVPLLMHMFWDLPILQNHLFQLIVCLPVYLLGATYFGKSALGSIKAGSPNMDVLIFVGSTAAFIYSLIGTFLGLGHNYIFYETSASIITLVLMGNILERTASKHAADSIEAISRIAPEKAKRIVLSGINESIAEIESLSLVIDDKILVNQGDKVPTDGEVYWGEGSVDESMITGESEPVFKKVGDTIIGGTLLLSGSIKFRAAAVGEATVLSGIIRLVRDAQASKPSIHRLADRVSAVFVPIVVSISLLTFIVVYFVLAGSFQQAMMNSIAVLVIACPCAMGLATPAAVMVGLGRAAREGILFRYGSTIEELTQIKTIVFDKTGTLTDGKFRILSLISKPEATDRAKSIIRTLEDHSSHPIAISLVKELSQSPLIPLRSIEEKKGVGVFAVDSNGSSISVTSEHGVNLPIESPGHDLYVADSGQIIACIDIADQTKPHAAETIKFLKERGLIPVLLSGDRKRKCQVVANELGISEMFYEKLPEEKLQIIESLSAGKHVAMIGDGINDAAALTRATVGISLGTATGVAIQSAEVILLNNDIGSLPKAIKISELTLRTIKQNLFWAFFYNVLAIPFAAFGYLTPIIGAGAMAFSDLVVIGNSMRIKGKKL